MDNIASRLRDYERRALRRSIWIGAIVTALAILLEVADRHLPDAPQYVKDVFLIVYSIMITVGAALITYYLIEKSIRVFRYIEHFDILRGHSAIIMRAIYSNKFSEHSMI